MIRVSVSLIEWKEGEIVPGVIPAGAVRLNRIALMARPGQRATLLLGNEENEGVLRDGMRFEVEPNVGASDMIIDLRLSLEVRSSAGLNLSTGLALERGKPLLLSLGRAEGRSLGAVIEARLEPEPEW